MASSVAWVDEPAHALVGCCPGVVVVVVAMVMVVVAVVASRHTTPELPTILLPSAAVEGRPASQPECSLREAAAGQMAGTA